MTFPLILSSPFGVAVAAGASPGAPSLVVLPGAVQIGGGSGAAGGLGSGSAGAVRAGAATLSGADVAAWLDAAPFRPGADPSVPVLPRHVRDGSLGLERLQTVPIEKGGTGRESFGEGQALFFEAGEGIPAPTGAIASAPALAWDASRKELVFGGRLSVGGLEIAASASRGLK